MLGRTLTLSSALVVVVTMARLLVVSNYQVPTAIIVAQGLGAVSTLSGTLLPLIGVLLPIVTILLAATTVLAAPFVALGLVSRLLFATAVTFAATLLVSPTIVTTEQAIQRLIEVSGKVADALAWGDYVTIDGIVLAILAIGAVRSAQLINFPWERYLATSAIGLTVIGILFAVATYAYPLTDRLKELPSSVGRMWLAPETLTTEGGTVSVGYVLSTTGEWTTVLWERDRTVGILPTKSVTARAVCRLGPPDDPPLVSTASAIPSIAACPSTK